MCVSSRMMHTCVICNRNICCVFVLKKLAPAFLWLLCTAQQNYRLRFSRTSHLRPPSWTLYDFFASQMDGCRGCACHSHHITLASGALILTIVYLALRSIVSIWQTNSNHNVSSICGWHESKHATTKVITLDFLSNWFFVWWHFRLTFEVKQWIFVFLILFDFLLDQIKFDEKWLKSNGLPVTPDNVHSINIGK